MNDRIKKLREQSLNAEAKISLERAELLTEFYLSDEAKLYSTPVKRAKAFEYLLSHKTLCLNDGELIVGERGPEPKATPTYPELCLHSIQDFEILNSREKIPFKVDKELKAIQTEKIIPFWQGQSIRDKIFNEMDQEWKTAYSAGVFTEFMEQRAPGHTVLDDKIYKMGMKDFIVKINKQIGLLDFENDDEALAKREELKAMHISANALIAFAKRYSVMLFENAKSEKEYFKKR